MVKVNFFEKFPWNLLLQNLSEYFYTTDFPKKLLRC